MSVHAASSRACRASGAAGPSRGRSLLPLHPPGGARASPLVGLGAGRAGQPLALPHCPARGLCGGSSRSCSALRAVCSARGAGKAIAGVLDKEDFAGFDRPSGWGSPARPGRLSGGCRSLPEETKQPAASSGVSSPLPPPPGVGNDAAEKAKALQRLTRLESVVSLRRLYRCILSAEQCMDMEFVMPDRPLEFKSDEDGEEHSLPGMDGDDDDEESINTRQLVAETQNMVHILKQVMQTKGRLMLLYRSMKGDREGGFRLLFEDWEAAEGQIGGRVGDLTGQLKARLDEAEEAMPYNSLDEAERSLEMVYDMVGPELLGRLVDAEKQLEKRIKSLRPGERLQQIKEKPVESGQRALSGLEGVWIRLNGGRTSAAEHIMPEGVPEPLSGRRAVEEAIKEAAAESDRLERELQTAAKARDTTLRQAGGVLGRAKLAKEIRNLDDQVSDLRRRLAVTSLSLEMERVYAVLEEEALELSDDMRTDDEVALLVAEFGLLDGELSQLRVLMDRGEALLISDDQLASLATEIPDLKDRLGVLDVSNDPLSWDRLVMQVEEGVAKAKEGGVFYFRGTKLLFADLSSSTRLFARAIRGGSLRPREVLVLRRTARDILTFVPFVIILIIPLTPLGHVLIFGFLQKYFPGFFPSQFSNRRQELFIRYEELEAQMRLAEEEAMSESDALEFRRKAAQLAEAAAEGSDLAWADGGGEGAVREAKGEGKESGSGELPAERKLRKLEAKAAKAAGQAFISDAGEDDKDGGGFSNH